MGNAEVQAPCGSQDAGKSLPRVPSLRRTRGSSRTGRKVPSAGSPDGSCVRRESHAQFCERPEVQFLRPTHHRSHSRPRRQLRRRRQPHPLRSRYLCTPALVRRQHFALQRRSQSHRRAPSHRLWRHPRDPRYACHVLSVEQPWRHVEVTDRHTAVDFAHMLRDLSDTHFPGAKKIVLMEDNLNTHKPASL